MISKVVHKKSNMTAGPASYGMTDTMGRMHPDAQFAGQNSESALLSLYSQYLLRHSFLFYLTLQHEDRSKSPMDDLAYANGYPYQDF